MGVLFDSYDVEPIIGKDITIGKYFPEVFISESDEVFCYVGACVNDSKHSEQSLFVHPYYIEGKHSTDKHISEKIIAFYH